MRIGVNLLFLQPQRNRGTYTYVINLLQALSRISGLELYLFVTPKNDPLFAGVSATRIVAPISGKNRVIRISWEQSWLPYVARRNNCSVLFCPGYMAPIWTPLPTVVTIHDMQFRDIPHAVGFGFRCAYNLIVPLAARNASLVIAVSHFSKERILKHIRLDPRKVLVTHEAAVAAQNLEIITKEAVLRKKYQLKRNYLLSVSSSAPYKNVDKLVDAFCAWRQQTKAEEELILVGHHRDWFEFKYPNAEASGIRLLGFLPNEDLAGAYTAAKGFILASSYEGFGLPILEAMQFGLPVACSDRASLPEVGGSAALYFNPDNRNDIIRAINTVMSDSSTREMLMLRNRENLKRFSWEKCATETVEVFNKAVNFQLSKIKI